MQNQKSEKEMAKYVFPAVFTKEDEGMYSIHFPDVIGCATQGNDLLDGMEMAQDALCLILHHKEEKKENIPLPSDPLSIKTNKDSFVSLIRVDTDYYRSFFKVQEAEETMTTPLIQGGLTNEQPVVLL